MCFIVQRKYTVLKHKRHTRVLFRDLGITILQIIRLPHKMEWTNSKLKHLPYQVNCSCIEVHNALGSGLLESVYHKCLIAEFSKKKLTISQN